MIDGVDFARSDRALATMFNEQPDSAVQMMTTRLRVQRAALERYIQHHVSTFRQMLIRQGIELDPRLDAVAATMFRQMLFAGIWMGREEEEKS